MCITCTLNTQFKHCLLVKSVINYRKKSSPQRKYHDFDLPRFKKSPFWFASDNRGYTNNTVNGVIQFVQKYGHLQAFEQTIEHCWMVLSSWLSADTWFALTADANVIIRRAKLHNDSSCDISQDGRLLCTFIQSSCEFNGDVRLGVFSLQRYNRGDCLYTKIFGKLCRLTSFKTSQKLRTVLSPNCIKVIHRRFCFFL